jgi:hypothetical protein
MKPTSQKVLEYTSIIAASLEAVFRVNSDPRSKLLWVPAIGCVEIESDRPLGLETPYLASAGIGLLKFVFREQIMEWVENWRVAYGGRSLWANLKQKRISICARVGLDCTTVWTTFFPGAESSLGLAGYSVFYIASGSKPGLRRDSRQL